MSHKRQKKEGRHPLRILFLGLAFLIASLFYITRLVNIQITGRDRYTSSTVRTYSHPVTIRAQRGEIFDRNGKPLVTNAYTYELAFDYGTLPRKAAASNRTILTVIQAVREIGTEENLVPDKSPFLGEYPNLIYKDALWQDEAYLTKFRKTMKTLELEEDIKAADLVQHYVDTYALLAADETGEPLYTNREITELVAMRFNMDYAQFSTAEPYVYAQNIDITLITYLREHEVRGVTFTETVERQYAYPGYASHILGRVGKIYAEDLEYYSEKGYKMNAIVGTSGCEEAFEDYLHGTDGTMIIEEDAYGNVISKRITKEPVSGSDVWLTLDIDMQIAAEDGLKDNIRYIVDKARSHAGRLDGEDASAGAVAAVGVGNGDVYVLASFPTYDLSTFSLSYNDLLADETTPLLNRALNGRYQPGSTFKVGMAAAALEEGIITPSTRITDLGQYNYYGPNGPRCWIYLQKGRTHGTINVIEAIQESCNYFFYDVGRQLTIETMNRYCRLYGLGEATGIELPEVTGVLAGPEYRRAMGLDEWFPGDTLQAAIGQSDNLFTPLQISCYIAALVGGGDRYAAHLFGSARQFFTHEVLEEAEPQVLSSVSLSSSTYQTLMTAMKSVTENGSASSLFKRYAVTVGGKTGTAQVSKNKSDNAIFTAFAPYDDPQIVCTCVIEQGNSGTDAGRTVKNVFDCYFGIGAYAEDS